MNIDDAIIVEVAKTIFTHATEVAHEFDEVSEKETKVKSRDKNLLALCFYSAFCTGGDCIVETD